jgi:hypothetical protein
MTRQPTLEEMAANAERRVTSTPPEIRRRSRASREQHDVARAMLSEIRRAMKRRTS